ncbi:LOW QUALITY PROTEIN: protein STICHEL-like 4 [Mangifera indica]|uniref:LOW QUALITY PROTEIN: protein STICHEL-like 4 n=1 Tax=Mangifera indica TaxID=29780 RepID=UPI001CFC1B7B|nr:LOW QUALITY PROTEIN: protein STICHEL-like 4 [Mangifera indica]
MTKAVRDRILKDVNGNISDHLRNHIHLTNCIHLKNHMHKQSPILADRSLMRDLTVLQRSRSLRDPSASPPSWHSPSVVDLLPKKGEKDATKREGRRSTSIECLSRLSGTSPPLPNVVTSQVAPAEVVVLNEGVVAAIRDRSSKSGNHAGRRVRREESSRKSRTDFLGGSEELPETQDGNFLVQDVVSGNYEIKGRKSKKKGKQSQDVRVKTLSEQLGDILMDSDDLVSSNVQFHGRRSRLERTGEEPEVSIHGYTNQLNRGKRRKFRGTRRNRTASLRDIKGQSEMSVASNSLAQGSARPRYRIEEEEEYGDKNVTRAPRNGCGIPWNWSRIHHRGKTFLDMAGRSLTSCGLSDSRMRKGASHGRDIPMPVASDHSISSTKSDAEALPLLVEASGSQESTENHWMHDYSGELGIFADHLLKNDIDSDLASEGTSGDQHKLGANRNGRHQNLTQKYMPRTFRDLVGQNLVAQALSNAAMRRKVGLLYVFYGPHGTGKTSCARIFARALNCQSLEHPKPCGFCNSCISHDMGKSRNICEVGPVSNFDFEGILNLLDNMVISKLPSQYRIFVFDDCDSMSSDCWTAISKVTDRAPRRMVIVLVSSSLDVLPHIIISRCQKFFFPKLKDADIIDTLRWIASKEDIEIDKDALKLIASRSDGSLRDAEMTLEQLSLLGQRISVPLVQELVGLISDEKLVDLLDLALSADTVNTVKNLRVIMETGVEPFALMSQLATVITDILAGSYDFTKDRHRRRFFRRQRLSKEDMEKLRQALKTLSEAEKQLRTSNDKLTWLTAALLQLAPDQQYILPSSSADTSFNQSPFALDNAGGRNMTWKGGDPAVTSNKEAGMSMNVRLENFHAGSSGDFIKNSMMKGPSLHRERHVGAGMAPQQTSTDTIRLCGRQISGKSHTGIEETWLEVLKKIQNNGIKEFLYREGRLISVSFGAAPTVHLMFSSHLTKSKAEKFKDHIFLAFKSVLGSPVRIEIRCESRNDSGTGFHSPLSLAPKDSQMFTNVESNTGNGLPSAGSLELNKRVTRDRGINEASAQAQLLHAESLEMERSEIFEVPASPRGTKDNDHAGSRTEYNTRGGSTLMGDASTSQKKSPLASTLERRKHREQSQSQSLVRGKVSLAHVLQQAEGCTLRSGWSRRKAVSIAEKLEQENLRLEPRSKSLLCWKATQVTRRKLSRLKTRTRKPHSLLKLVSCGKCLSSKSPR